jgi:DNA polymerase-3 subunit alpha
VLVGVPVAVGRKAGVVRTHERPARRGLAHLACEVEGKLVNRKVFECLVKAGCFDSTSPSRRALAEGLDALLADAQKRWRDREQGQGALFAAAAGPEAEVDPNGPEWPTRERLGQEKEALGLYLSGNPLEEHETELRRLTTHTLATLRESPPEGTVTVGGVVSRVRNAKIKSGPNAGRMMGRFHLEDLEGRIPAVLFANQFQQFGRLIEDEAVLLVTGVARERGSDLELNVEQVVALDKAARKLLLAVELEVDAGLSASAMMRLRELLIEHAGDTPLKLTLTLGDRRVRIAPGDHFKVRCEPELVTALEKILGRGRVHERYVA